MSDETTTIGKLKDKIRKFQQARNWNPEAKNLAISIAIEAAELLENFQWDGYQEYQKLANARRIDVEKELADVIIYCIQFATKMKIDVSRAVQKKLSHNAKKYPARLFKGEKAGEQYYKIKEQYRKRKSGV